MECNSIKEKLCAYLEGTLSSEEKKLIKEHLNSCHQCNTTLEDLKMTGELVKSLEEVEPPAWMTQKIMARVRTEQEKKRGIFQKLFYPLHIKVPIEALATVLIAVVAVYVFRAVEPEMKRAQAPSGSEQAISKDEALKQPLVPEEKSPARGNAIPKEPPRLARSQEEKRAADKLEEAPSIIEANKPAPAEPPLPSMLTKKEGAIGGRD